MIINLNNKELLNLIIMKREIEKDISMADLESLGVDRQ